jgi:hypothetical protein
MMSLTRGGFKIKPEIQNKTPLMDAMEVKGVDLNVPHVRNFLDCMKSRARPNGDILEGHLTAVMCHLGNISTRLGRTLRWDAGKEEVMGDAEAHSWLMRDYRGAWKLG